ncbi:hypothetical protein ACLQ2R_04785 [Streptosporangium sp. DT93]|uniref:hypothetical protein n=1 Tax=Streptosporangium sp. DT93 TaxID=3393428 RepID=UPI003CEBDC60
MGPGDHGYSSQDLAQSVDGLKLQQPTPVGLGIGAGAVLGDGGRGDAGGANTQRGVSGVTGPWFAISRTPGSAVRPSQGARLQHEARSPGRQGSRERRSGGSGTTARAGGVGDGTTVGTRTSSDVSVSGSASWTPVLPGVGLGACEGRRADAVDGVADGAVGGGVVARRDGLVEGFGEAGLTVADVVGFGVAVGAGLVLGLGVALALVLGLGVALVLGLGVVLVLGLGVVLVVGLGAVLALVVGFGAGCVAVPEGAGLDGGVPALDDGAGLPSVVGLVAGSRSSGGGVGAAFFGAAWDDFGAADGFAARAPFLGAVAVVRGASAFLRGAVAVVRGASSVERVLPDGEAVVLALLVWAGSCPALSRRGVRDCSTGASLGVRVRSSGDSRGATLVPVGRSAVREGNSSVSGRDRARSRGAPRFPVSSGEVFLVDRAGGSASTGGLRSDREGGSACGMSASETLPRGATSSGAERGSARGAGAYSCEGAPAFTPGSATAAHG